MVPIINIVIVIIVNVIIVIIIIIIIIVVVVIITASFCCRQNLADAIRQDEKVDRKIARNQNKFEALDFNAAVGDSRMSPASAFVATIRGEHLNWQLT